MLTSMTAGHPNSRQITIFWKESFIMNAQKGAALEFVSMSKKSIGSYWEKSSSKTQGSGLNFLEQEMLMPGIVDCEAKDRNFRIKVSEFFASKSTTVPYDTGLTLEIGLTVSNAEPLSDGTQMRKVTKTRLVPSTKMVTKTVASKTLGADGKPVMVEVEVPEAITIEEKYEVTEPLERNMPLNIDDYITYRHALSHPQVAATKDDVSSSIMKEFYIFDPQATEDANLVDSDEQDKATAYYLQIKKTPEKVDMLLTLLLVDPREFTGKNAMALKLVKLKQLSEKRTKEFIAFQEDKFLDMRYDIQTMINTGILNKYNERIVDADNGDVIGHTMAEAISWMKDRANSDRLVILKARMQEGMSHPLAATSKAAGRRK